MNQLKVKLTVAILTWVLGACASTGAISGGDRWQEEVLLHDGQKIIVERSQTYGGRSEPGQSGPIKEHSIRFTLPGSSKTITWTSESGADIGRTNFNLLAVHVLNGTPYVVAEPNLCLSYNKWGRPNPPYVFFKYEVDAWQRVTLEQFPIEFKTINVALSIRDQALKDMVRMKLVPSATISQMNAHRQQAEFKAILREPLPNGGSACRIEFTNGKGLWLSADWFSGKKDLQNCLSVCQREDFSEAACPCKHFFKGE